MMNEIKRFFPVLFSIFLVFGIVGTSNATTYEYNFDTLDAGDTSAKIELYMENTLPKDDNVVVDLETKAKNDSTSSLYNDVEDIYIQSGVAGTTVAGTTIEIYFEDRNITQIGFDWEGVGEKAGDRFLVYADDEIEPFFSHLYTELFFGVYYGRGISDLGTSVSIKFVTSVKTLTFRNEFDGGFVALDNLWIENSGDVPPIHPVPEPATMLLFGSGLIGLAVVGRKKMKKVTG